jgi:hypothetical protein
LRIGTEASFRLKENSYARNATGGPAKGAKLPINLPLDRLWQTLQPDDQQHLLKTLSQLIVKQLQTPPPSEKEVGHES